MFMRKNRVILLMWLAFLALSWVNFQKIRDQHKASGTEVSDNSCHMAWWSAITEGLFMQPFLYLVWVLSLPMLVSFLLRGKPFRLSAMRGTFDGSGWFFAKSFRGCSPIEQLYLLTGCSLPRHALIVSPLIVLEKFSMNIKIPYI
ncbi:hypothetical protein ACOSQ2_021268 [Xanthoceras sorbifolium]